MSATRTAGALAALLLAAACVACAHPDPAGRMAVWQLCGTVVVLDRADLRVRHKAGQVVEVQVDGETLFVRDDQTASAAVVHAGAHVVVEVEPLGGGRQRARRVQIFGG